MYTSIQIKNGFSILDKIVFKQIIRQIIKIILSLIIYFFTLRNLMLLNQGNSFK